MKKSNVNLWLSLSVAPFLALYGGGRALYEWSIEVGKASEELFRGDRLPILPVQDPEIETRNESEKR
jgi:hypothetical protein